MELNAFHSNHALMVKYGIQLLVNVSALLVLFGMVTFAFSVVVDKPIKPMLDVSAPMEHFTMVQNAHQFQSINALQSQTQFGTEMHVFVTLVIL